MRQALVAVAICTQLGGCGFAVKHPAATAAIVGGSLGFGLCELNVGRHGTCAIVGGSAGAFLGIVAAVAMWTMGGNEEEHALYEPLLPGETDPVQGGATDGSPDGTEVDAAGRPIDPPPPPTRPAGPVVPKEKQTPIPRLPAPEAGSGSAAPSEVAPGSGSGSATPLPTTP